MQSFMIVARSSPSPNRELEKAKFDAAGGINPNE